MSRVYDKRAWLRLRQVKLQPLCELCLPRGKLEPATVVDHIIAIESGGDFAMPEPEPDVVITWRLTSDMTHNDLVKVFEHLPRRDESYIIRLDRDVRDYLLRILKQRKQFVRS